MINKLSFHPIQADPTAVQEGPYEDIVLTPMVITRIDDVYGCVSALSPDGHWVRPEPVLTGEVTGASPYYRYRHPFHCRITASSAADRRPEDRELVAQLDLLPSAEPLSSQHLQAWMASHCDANVEDAFACERSVGLVEAAVERIYLQRSTQQRLFVRMVFRDASDTRYDWIVPDVSFSSQALEAMRGAADPELACAPLLQKLKKSKIFLAVTLTQPNNRFPGVFHGCQPLVGGVHSFPDYRNAAHLS